MVGSDQALFGNQRPSDSSLKPLSALPNRNHREALDRQHLASAGRRLAVVLSLGKFTPVTTPSKRVGPFVASEQKRAVTSAETAYQKGYRRK